MGGMGRIEPVSSFTLKMNYFCAFLREFVEEKFKYFDKNNCRFVLVFAQGKRQAHPGDIHHVVKLMEQKHSKI